MRLRSLRRLEEMQLIAERDALLAELQPGRKADSAPRHPTDTGAPSCSALVK